jgi:hypothetical protein
MLAGTTADATDVREGTGELSRNQHLRRRPGCGRPSLFRRKWKRPSYISAKAFADAITEMTDLDMSTLPAGIAKRVEAIVREATNDLRSVKAGLEGWFDENMSRVEGAYKRWVTMLLFVIGSLIADHCQRVDVSRRRPPLARSGDATGRRRLRQQGRDRRLGCNRTAVGRRHDGPARGARRARRLGRSLTRGLAPAPRVADLDMELGAAGVRCRMAPHWHPRDARCSVLVRPAHQGRVVAEQRTEAATAQQDPTSATRKEAEPDQAVALKVAVADDRTGG